jgi:hypothetical protein
VPDRYQHQQVQLGRLRPLFVCAAAWGSEPSGIHLGLDLSRSDARSESAEGWVAAVQDQRGFTTLAPTLKRFRPQLYGWMTAANRSSGLP